MPSVGREESMQTRQVGSRILRYRRRICIIILCDDVIAGCFFCYNVNTLWDNKTVDCVLKNLLLIYLSCVLILREVADLSRRRLQVSVSVCRRTAMPPAAGDSLFVDIVPLPTRVDNRFVHPNSLFMYRLEVFY